MSKSSTATTANPYTIVILVFSILGFLSLVFFDFGGIYIYGYYSGYRSICFLCEYSTGLVDLAIFLAGLLLLGQILISLNELVTEKFLPEALSEKGFLLAISTLVIIIFGGLVLLVGYSEYDWWFETGFYGGFVAGLVNSILFYLKEKSV